MSTLQLRGSVFDDVGRMISDVVDHWEGRSGIADGLINIAPYLPESATMLFMKIIVPDGLNDRKDICRGLMCNAAIEVVKKVIFFLTSNYCCVSLYSSSFFL